MEDLYVELKDISSDLISSFGKPIVLIKKFLDPVWVKEQRRERVGVITLWRNTETEEEVFDDPTKEIKYKGFAVEGSYKGQFYPGITVNVGDIRLYIVDTPRPVVGDTVFVEGNKRTVVTCSPIAPGTIDILYDVQAR